MTPALPHRDRCEAARERCTRGRLLCWRAPQRIARVAQLRAKRQAAGGRPRA